MKKQGETNIFLLKQEERLDIISNNYMKQTCCPFHIPRSPLCYLQPPPVLNVHFV